MEELNDVNGTELIWNDLFCGQQCQIGELGFKKKKELKQIAKILKIKTIQILPYRKWKKMK